MARNLKFALLLSFVICASFTTAYSQNQKGPTHLVLAVTYISGRDPAFQTVPWSDPRGAGTWYAGFVPIKSFHLATPDMQVQAIRIVPEVEGDAVRVKVFTMYGQRYFDKELPVANYLLSVNDTVRVDELKEYGVQPFEIRLFRALPSAANLPSFVTNAPSISGLNVRPNNTTLPSVTVTLRNLSYKEVIAIGVNVIADGKIRFTALPRGREGRNLIEAGGTYDHLVLTAVVSQTSPKEATPVSVPAQKILITAVLFRDGTFEGDCGAASRAAAHNLGEKIMLGKLLPIFDKALSSDNGNSAEILEQLRADVAPLVSDVDPKVAEELAGKFPSITPEAAKQLKEVIDIGSNGVKTDLLKRLDANNSGKPEQTTNEPFHALLGRIRDGIKDWHDRL